MAYTVGKKVELTVDYTASFTAGSCGKVLKRYQNGNYRVRMTHNKDCQPFPAPGTLPSVKPEHLKDCHCD